MRTIVSIERLTFHGTVELESARPFFLVTLVVVLCLPLATFAQTSSAPSVFLLDAEQLQATKQRIRAGDKSVGSALAKLERDANKALASGPFSVVTKEFAPPSCDKHDYLRQAPYFWSNPQRTNGLPYI